MGLFDFFKRKTNHKAVFLGLDNSGKSTIISFLQEGRFINHTPTMGKKKLEMDVGGTRISLFDMGGQEDFRQLWSGEVNTAKVVAFVIDKAAPERFGEAIGELNKILPTILKNSIQLLIMANKHDIRSAAPLGTIIEAFGLTQLDNFEVVEISAKTGYGMADAFTKFYTMLTGEQVKKNKLTKGISVYNKGGVPIISQLDDVDNIERKAIEGGFLVAITQFCNLKMEDDEETNIISFESQKNGTFLVARSQHYIGSLLWQENLGVPIEQSKAALKDLLHHLENTCNHENEENIAFHVEHYTTNMM
ncbi:MAG: ADP-ribosylation factor-like protein [Candidatus Hodarchaeota archaeon]